MTDKKCNEVAEKYRCDGNEHFNSGEFLEALVSYNKSLCHAQPNTQQLCLAYANRSAVFLKAKIYDKCLQNIELAREHGYPEDKMQKLVEREQRCMRLMRSCQVQSDDFFELSFPANPKIPFIANCLEVREDKKYGRFVITSIDLKLGEIIAIDEPVHKFLDKDVCHRRCTNCMRSNDLSLFPCSSCTNTMYCSTICKNQCEKFIHQFECCKEPMFESDLLALKMVFSALSVAGSVDELRNILEHSTCKTVFDLDLSNPKDPMYHKNVLLAVNALTTVRETDYTKLNPLNVMFNEPPFDELLKTEEDREFIRKFARNQMKILDTNLYDMKEHTRLKTANQARRTLGQSIGSGLCLFASLFSHSCDPSVKRITVDNKIAFVVVRPIAAGQQIFISYGYSSYDMPLEMRREHLKSYGFICDCEACAKKYMLLVRQPRNIEDYIEPDHEMLTRKAAIKEFKKSCKFISKIISRHPCYETTDMIIYCDHLLHQISKVCFEEIGMS